MIAFINWNIDPEIFNLFGIISIRYYGILFVSGLIIGYLIVKQIFKKENESIESLDKITLYIFIGTILGARLGHCIFYEPEYYLSNPLEIFLPIRKGINGGFEFTGFQGLASHGGAIGVLIAIILGCKKINLNLLWFLDRVAIAVPITGAFIRFGNFMNSEIIGKPTNSNYGIVFERVDLLPRHPTQLYEAFSYILIFGLLYLLYRKYISRFENGFIFGLFMFLLFTARLVIEFYKINQVEFESGMIINMGQILSIPFIICGMILMIWKLKPRA